MYLKIENNTSNVCELGDHLDWSNIGLEIHGALSASLEIKHSVSNLGETIQENNLKLMKSNNEYAHYGNDLRRFYLL